MKGYIYKISSPEIDKIYIGSTTLDINKRFTIHKQQYKNYMKQNQSYISSFDILKCNESKIDIVEEIIFQNSKELREREKHHRELNKDKTVNKNSPLQTDIEKKQQMKRHNDLRKDLNYNCPVCVTQIRLKSKYAHNKCKKHIKKKSFIIVEKKEAGDIVVSFTP